MRYIIIGLGIYGANLARNLTAQGHEVIGVDSIAERVDALKDYLSTVYQLDCTEESSLAVLPLKNVDLVIVAIGENFGASVRTVALLKQAGVKHMYARAIDELHHSILECFNLDRILTPEQRAADDLAKEMVLGSDIRAMNIDSDNFIVRFTAPPYFLDMAYASMRIESDFGVRLIAAARPTAESNIIGVTVYEPQRIDITKPDERVQQGDIFTCLTTKKSFRAMMKKIS